MLELFVPHLCQRLYIIRTKYICTNILQNLIKENIEGNATQPNVFESNFNLRVKLIA